MGDPIPSQIDLARGRQPAKTHSNKSQRYFYNVAAIVIFVITVVGFQPFYFKGEGMAGREISPQLLPLVVVHGALMTAWVILFLVQSVLISARRRRLHMKLGWGVVGVAVGVVISGFMVAVQSVRPVPDIPFWGMAYREFLLVMLAEMMLFTLFVLMGVLSRKRPEIHRAMMLLASLSILAGATVRMPVLFPIFGEGGWMGIFGPIFALGAVFLVVRSFLKGALDRWFAVGYAAMVLVYVAASKFAVTNVWSYLAKAIFNT